MQISAISMQSNNGNNMLNNINMYKSRIYENKDTSFNSWNPYTSKKSTQNDNMPMVFDSVNQWKNFCHHRILGEKLNVIA